MKNYKGMENKVSPGGSNFEAIAVSAGVSITEGGKNKTGKQKKNNSMTRTEYILNASQSFMNDKTISFQLPNLNTTRGQMPDFDRTGRYDYKDNIYSLSKLDDAIDLNSTIKSSRQGLGKLSESHQILPPIDRLNYSLGRNTSFAKTISNDVITLKAKSKDIIEKSLIIKKPYEGKHLKGAKSVRQILK